MTTDELITALALPDSTRINLRVPKKQLAEQAATTTADKRQINEGIDEITWLAALKPQLIGVPEYRDAHRHYIELAVLGLTLKPGARSGRLTELLHRAVPYPVLLISQPETGLKLSLAHLRTAHNEADKTVLDGDLLSIGAIDFTPDFLAAMALERQPQTDLYALYQGWMDTVGALDIARETGRFQPSHSREHAALRHALVQQCRALHDRVTVLRGQATKEKQMARQIALNQELRQIQGELQILQASLVEVSQT
jgi:hypothetical protein